MRRHRVGVSISGGDKSKLRSARHIVAMAMRLAAADSEIQAECHRLNLTLSDCRLVSTSQMHMGWQRRRQESRLDTTDNSEA